MSIGDDYLAAVKAGNTAQANYLAKMLTYQAGIDINANTVEAAPLSYLQPGNSGLPTLPSLPSLPDFLGQSVGVLGSIPILGGIAAGAVNMMNASGVTGAATKAGSSTGQALSSAGNALSIDWARWGTAVLGGLIIAAGLFGLAGGQASHVMQLVKAPAP